MMTADELRGAADAAHRQIWEKFVSPDGTMYDYTNRKKEVILPTAENCKNLEPNGLGWWTPIENGSFFGGVYMDALCTRYELEPSEELAGEARAIAAGLVKMGTCGEPGFIGRGFAVDGVSHYPASSDDQSYPWFFGLWRYVNSPIPTAEEKQKIIAVVERNGDAFRANGWRIPSDRAGFGFFGGWEGDHFDANVRRLFVMKAMAQLTGKAEWEDLYRKNVNQKFGHRDITRLGVICEGANYIEPTKTPNYPHRPPIWTSTSSQAGLRALIQMETDETVRAAYREALNKNAERALPHLLLHRQFSSEAADQLPFNVDWRSLNDPANGFVPQKDIKEAIKLGIYQYQPWKKLSPRRIYENDYMRDPLFAAYVIFLSDNQAAIAEAAPEFAQMMKQYPWDQLYSVCFFMAENAYWASVKNQKGSAGK